MLPECDGDGGAGVMVLRAMRRGLRAGRVERLGHGRLRMRRRDLRTTHAPHQVGTSHPDTLTANNQNNEENHSNAV